MAEGSSAAGASSSSNRGLGFRWSLQHSFNPHLNVAAEAPRRLREDLHQVIRGLSPLVERSQSISLSTLLRHPRSQSRLSQDGNSTPTQNVNPPHVNNHNEFVITMDSPQDGNGRMAENGVSVSTASNNNNLPTSAGDGNASQQTDVLRHSPELRALVSVAEKYLPFLFILLAKLIFDHKTGILVLIGLIVTFTHANAVVKREVGKQNKRNLGSLLAVAINLLTCIFFIYYVFETDKLYYSLGCVLPARMEPLTFWDLLWIVGITDFVLKLITVLCKAVIIVLPAQFIAFQKKGKYYLFIEQTSQLYRSFAPIQPWIWYLLEAYEGVGKIFGLIMSGVYIVSKGKDILKKGRSWRASLSKLMQSVSYGTKPSKEQIDVMGGNLCPICQDDFRQPTMLQCKVRDKRFIICLTRD